MIDIVATLTVLLFSTWLAARYIRRFGPDERALLWCSFFAHQAASMVNILVTRYYYGWGDMLSYHQYGVAAADLLHADFWGIAPDLIGLILHQFKPIPIPIETLSSSSGSMQGISSFAMFFLFDSLYAVCSLIATLAFLSKAALYSVVRAELPELPHRATLAACTLLPSMLFWSSSLLKEPIAMIGLFFAIYGWHQLYENRPKLGNIALICLGCTAVFATKAYILPALGIAGGAWHFARKVQERRGDITFKAGHVVIAGLMATALIAATGALLPEFAADSLSDQLAGLQTVGTETEGGSNYSLGRTAGSPGSQAALAPLGLATALFRPLPYEVKAAIAVPSAIETALFVVCAILALIRRGILASFTEVVRRPFLSFCVTFVLVFGTCVGLGTTNLGTLSRYRVPLIPFFAVLLLGLMAQARAPYATSRTRVSRAADPA